MFFIKSYTQSFMMEYLVYKSILITENKNREYLNNDHKNVTKFMKITSNLTHNRQRTQKGTERQKN